MRPDRHRGFTLVEMVITIVILSVGLAGVLAAFTTTVRGSGDPMLRKQMVAIAEAMLEEIALKPYSDPGTAGSIAAGSCDRSLADDVQDYAGYSNRAVCDIDGTPVADLASYQVSVTLDAAATLGALAAGVTKITVTVDRTGGDSFSLTGFRTNYAGP